MKNVKVKRWLTGLFAAAVVAVTPVYALAAEGDEKDLDNVTPSGETSVTASVDGESPTAPSYVIAIPSKVDFGTIKQPAAEANSYVTRDITVRSVTITNLPTGSAVAVLVKDSAATQQTDPFKLVKDNNDGIYLTYQILNPSGNSIQDEQWYTNGFLFNAFTASDQTATNTLRLNQKQLYGKDLATYAGSYTGTLNFFTRVADINDVQ